MPLTAPSLGRGPYCSVRGTVPEARPFGPCRRGGAGRVEVAAVAAKKRKKRGLKPRLPARVKKRTRTKRAHGRYSELYGLGLAAAGLFLGIVLYGGWDGGMVGGPLSDAVHGFVGAAAYLMPLGFVAIGSLMVARSELVDFRPFRVGL